MGVLGGVWGLPVGGVSKISDMINAVYMTLLWIVFDKRIKTRIKIELYGNMFVVVYQSSVAVVISCRWLVEAIPGKMP